MKQWIHILASGFCSGYMPKMPGTWGTLAAIPLLLIVSAFGSTFYWLFLLAAVFGGIWICHEAAKDYDTRDPQCIVWDEIAGYFVTMATIPLSFSSIIVGFILFRIFDITKLPPISTVDKKVSGGLGIMLDDIIAGIFANIILQIIF